MTSPASPTVKISRLTRAMPTILRLRGSNKNYVSREQVRKHLDDLALRPRPVAAPAKLRKGVTARAVLRQDGWRIFTIEPATGKPTVTVVYLHGGGWIHEASSAHWKFVQQIAAEANARVVMPAYPLAHEGGTAATVVPAVVELYLQQPGPCVLMGDSAGGQIAMSATLALSERGVTVPLTVLISPALDMRLNNPDIDLVQPSDPWLVRAGQIELAEMWIGDHAGDPILNPIEGNLAGLGPLLIFSGTRDILNPDTKLFVAKAREAGVDVTYLEQDGSVHVFPLLPTPEAKEARTTVLERVRAVAAPA